MEEYVINTIFENIGIKVIDIESATNSFNSNVYIVYDEHNNKYIFKLLNNETKRLNEAKYYNYLYNYLPTSKVIDTGTIDRKNYNIITFFEGNNTYDDKCNELSKKEIYNLGRLLASIHTCKIVDPDDESWLNYLTDYIGNAKANLSSLIGDENNNIISSFLMDYLSNEIKNNYTNCILHMDFRIGNVIFKNEDTIGIIDLESMRNGDYVFDFVKVSRLFNKTNFNEFKKGYQSIKQIDESFSDRLAFYSFFDAYTSLYWCLTKNSLDSDYYKTNYQIVNKYLRKVKDGKWHL